MEQVVYVLYSPKFNRIYIGLTGNLLERIRSHNSPKNLGYTKSFQPWLVASVEFYPSRSHAGRSEKQLKSSRGRVEVWESIIPEFYYIQKNRLFLKNSNKKQLIQPSQLIF